MLIDKLNYLVDKKTDVSTPGGLLNAYQLTCKSDSSQKLGKQSGFLFYIPAWNTSKIDPVTGFVNLLDTHSLNSKEKIKAFFSKFDAIRYNKDKKWFEFNLDYDKFGKKRKIQGLSGLYAPEECVLILSEIKKRTRSGIIRKLT